MLQNIYNQICENKISFIQGSKQMDMKRSQKKKKKKKKKNREASKYYFRTRNSKCSKLSH